MIRLELIDVVKKQFPELDIANKEGIIKFSKVVKAEIKLFGNFSQQEVEEVINFLEKHGSSFDPLINHKNIAIILRSGEENITLSPVREKLSDEKIQEFAEIFSENILNYIKQCIKLNEWNNLKNLFRAYSFIINDLVKDETIKSLSLKNHALVLALQNGEYEVFVSQHAYATDVSYFAMLSTIDNFYFDEDILHINYALSNSLKKKSDFPILGKITYAFTFYRAYNDDINLILEDKKKAAFAMLNMTDTSSPNATHNNTSGCIIYIVVVIFFIILAFTVGVEIPRGLVLAIILIMKLIFFLSKK